MRSYTGVAGFVRMVGFAEEFCRIRRMALCVRPLVIFATVTQKWVWADIVRVLEGVFDASGEFEHCLVEFGVNLYGGYFEYLACV